eukprot:TRINITY_DN1637_c0_g1_i1.p1 TRINITY_DN1637_c0_g1~~TRINITY_DN1637_c0_g1_i1.p1  ORF type:complete len:408 (-),score=80.29 TRINITY_DN1637_c0_g1_i1:669-1892(-)
MLAARREGGVRPATRLAPLPVQNAPPANFAPATGSSGVSINSATSDDSPDFEPEPWAHERGLGGLRGRGALSENSPSSSVEEEKLPLNRARLLAVQSSRENQELLYSPVQAQQRPQRIDDHGISKLVEDLEGEDEEATRLATHQVRVLAKFSDENRALLADAGAVGPLAQLVRSRDKGIVGDAVAALLNIAIHDANKKLMPEWGVIEPLVEVLATGEELETRENAAATLFILSVLDENKLLIGESGAVEPLCDVLRQGSAQGQRDAVKALFNLSTLSTNKRRMVDAGVVQALVEFLEDPEGAMAEKAVSVMANLTTFPKGRQAIADAPQGIGGLVEVVECGTPRGKENAVAVLWQLAKNSEEHEAKILKELVIPPLVALTQAGTSRARDKAALLLRYLRGEDRDASD